MRQLVNISWMGILVLGLVGQAALASYEPDARYTVSVAKMKLVSGRYGFERARKIVLELTKKDGDSQITGMELSYAVPEEQTPGASYAFHQKSLVMQSISEDECGSTVYVATLGNTEKEGNLHILPIGPRFSVVLTDHSTRFCKDYKPTKWEANVREGFGWCGTGDSTMDLIGNPTSVAHVQ